MNNNVYKYYYSLAQIPKHFLRKYYNAAWIARFGSPLFLGLQMLTIIDMANTWNEAWVREGEQEPNYLYALLGITGT